MPEPAKRVSQQTFDEIVKENIDDLEMEEEEAYADAISQLESQGVDLSNIWTKPSGVANPLELVKKIEEGCPDDVETDVPDVSALLANIEALAKVIEEGGEPTQSLVGSNGGHAAFIRCINQHDEVIMPAALRAFRLLINKHVLNRDLVEVTGMAALSFAARSQLENPDLLAKCFCTIKAACIKTENNKINFSKSGGNELIFKAIEVHWEHTECLVETCGVLRTATARDDNRQEFSQAFDCAKLFVEKGILEHIAVPLKAIGEKVSKTAGNSEESIFDAAKVEAQEGVSEGKSSLEIQAMVGLCAAIKQLCTKNEAVKTIYDLGGLPPVVNVLTAYLGNPLVVKHTVSVMRCVAQIDDYKSDVATRIPLLVRIMEIHMKVVGVCEQVCATFANLALKQTELTITIAENGAIPLIVQSIREHLKDKSKKGNIAIFVRQAALAIRNMVVRNVENRQLFLDEGVEPLLREAHQYRHCDDEAYAALRDLQCEVASLNRKYTQKEAYEKASNFRDTFEESKNLSTSIQAEARAPFAKN